MFQKGNKHGKGRPPYSLKSPEILLPVIFSKGNLNWSRDFISLYRKMRDNEKNVTAEDRIIFKILYDLLPYLCTKIQVKDLDLEKLIAKESAVDAKKQTEDLVKLLEEEHIERKSKSSSGPSSLEDRQSTIPPQA